MPSFVGMTFDQAQAEATRVGVKLDRASFEPGSGQPENTVLSQVPPAGTKVDKGGVISLTLAAGATTVAVPDLRGQTEAQAIQSIITAGLGVGVRTDAFDPTFPIGSVVGQDPRPGLEISKGTAVNYVVSKGPSPSESPSESASESPSQIRRPTPDAHADPHPTPTPTPRPRQLQPRSPRPRADSAADGHPGADANAGTHAPAGHRGRLPLPRVQRRGGGHHAGRLHGRQHHDRSTERPLRRQLGWSRTRSRCRASIRRPGRRSG